MQRLSAGEAVGPAMERTKDVLFRHKDWRLFLKLSAAAALAGLGSGFNFNLSTPLRGVEAASAKNPALMAALIAAAAVIGVISLTFFLAFIYFGSRMQFVLIDLVVRRETRIAPLWRQYGSQTWRWIGLKFVIFLAFMVAVLLAMVPFFVYVSRHRGTKPGSFAFAGVAGMMLGVLALVFLFLAVAYQVRGFVLPVMALEGSTAGEGFRRLKMIWQHEPGQMVLFLFLRFVLGIVLGIAALLAMGIGMLIVALPVGGVGWALWHTLGSSGVALKLLLGAAAIVVGLFILAWIALLYVIVGGFISMFFQAYSLYFYGGRYPLLGELLEPPGQSWWNPGYGMMTPPIEPRSADY